MSGRTLDDLIEVKLEKENLTYDDYQEELDKNRELVDVLNSGQVKFDDKELNGFSVEEVIDAVRYTLEANVFGIDVTKMDLKDSPIYYNQTTKKSRWFRKRKKINESAALAIQRARQAVEANERKRRREREIQQKYIDQLESMELGEKLTDPREAEYADDPQYMENLENSQAKKCLERIETGTEVFDSIQGVINKAGESKREEKWFSKKETKDEDVIKRKLDEIDLALDKQLPGAKQLQEQILSTAKRKAMMDLQSTHYLMPADITDEELDKKIERIKGKYIKEAGQLVKTLNGLYEEVAAGRLSPEVLKIFLRTELMAYTTETEKQIYRSMIKRNQKISEPDPWDEQDYKRQLTELAKSRRTVGGCPPAEYQDYGGVTKFLNKKGEPIHTNDLDVLEDQAITLCKTFMHFHSKIIDPKIVSRYYITAKPGKQLELMKAWMRTMESHKELAEKIYFKVNGELQDKRKDNIVVYVSASNKEEEIKEFFDLFYKECGGKEGEILESNEDVLMSTIVSEDQNGITCAPEFSLKRIYDETIKYGLFTDLKLDEALYHSQKSTSYTSVTKPKNFSYNDYLAKALFYSAEILSKKKGIPRDKIMESIKNTPELKKQYMRYFADFIKLGGVDAITMKRNDT